MARRGILVLACVVLAVVRIAAADADADADADAELRELAVELSRALSQVNSRQAQAVTTPSELEQELALLLGEAVGLDHEAVAAMAEAAARQAAAVDVDLAHLVQAGPEGALWVFWAVDAPGSQVLPAALESLQEQRPGLLIHDVHVVGLRDWQHMFRRNHEVHLVLSRPDPDIALAEQAPMMNALVDAVMEEWSGFNRMAATRRDGGYLLMEDLRPAVALQVRRIPAFRYISPSGTVHRLEGLGGRTDLSQWIDRCLAWEEEHREEQEARLLP